MHQMVCTLVSVHHPNGAPDVYGVVSKEGAPPWFVPQQARKMSAMPLDPQFLLRCVPCAHHFAGSPGGCRYGSQCFYSHDKAVYMAFNRLRLCPNTGCENLCKGRQCRECHHKMLSKKQ